MPNRRSRSGAWFGLALMGLACLALLALEIYQGFWNAPDLHRNRERISHTFEVIMTAHALERSIRDAERSQRISLLTRDKSHLDAYRTAVRETPALLGKLGQMTADDPEQQRRLASLEHQLDANGGSRSSRKRSIPTSSLQG